MTRALVTGATGMLGRALVELLLEAHIDVRAYVRPTSDVAHWHDTPVEVVTGDLDQAVTGVDYVFHTAGYVDAAAPFTTEGSDPSYQSTNVDLTEQLLAASLRYGIRRFVYASSSSVYDINAPAPTPEDAPLKPTSIYGQSKLRAEQRVAEYQSQGLSTAIIRASVIYGPHDRHFMSAMTRLAKLPVLPLVNGGRNLQDLIFVRDVARIMLEAAHNPIADGRIYNAAPHYPVSLRDFFEAYRRVTGRGPYIISIPAGLLEYAARLVRPLVKLITPARAVFLSDTGLALLSQDLHLSMDRTRMELGYYNQVSLEEGIKEALA